MKVAAIFQRFLRPPVPPPPETLPGVPSDDEIRRAKQQVAQLVRQAEAMGIEVEMEEFAR